MVVVELRPHLQRFAHRHPARLVGIVAAAHGRQRAEREVEMEGMGDGAPAQAAVGVIEDMGVFQGALQHRQRQLHPGFLAQFAQAGIQHRFVLADEAPGQRPQALAGFSTSAHQQHVPGVHHHRIGGDEGGRIRRVDPRGAVLLDEAVFLDQLRERRRIPAERIEHVVHRRRHVGADQHQTAVRLQAVGLEQIAAQLGGRQRLGVGHVDQRPLRELAQVVAAGVLVLADQADARRGIATVVGHGLGHRALDRGDPVAFVVEMVAQRAHDQPIADIGQGGTDHHRALGDGPRVLDGAGGVG